MGVGLGAAAQYLPPVFEDSMLPYATPDDHFAAGPDCRVLRAAGALMSAGGCPTVGGRDCISRRCSRRGSRRYSAPDDHFTAGPHCCV